MSAASGVSAGVEELPVLETACDADVLDGNVVSGSVVLLQGAGASRCSWSTRDAAPTGETATPFFSNQDFENCEVQIAFLVTLCARSSTTFSTSTACGTPPPGQQCLKFVTGIGGRATLLGGQAVEDTGSDPGDSCTWSISLTGLGSCSKLSVPHHALHTEGIGACHGSKTDATTALLTFTVSETTQACVSWI